MSGVHVVAGVLPTPARRPRIEGSPFVVGILVAVGTVFLGLPIVALLARAALDAPIRAALGSPAIVDALVLSLGTTAASAVLTVVFGTPLAWVLARRRFRGSSLVETAVDLPLVLPPAVAGIALLLVFGRRGLVGPALEGIGVTVPFTTAAVVLAQTFVAAPFFVRSARTGFAGVDRDVEDAARADGAGGWAVFRHVTAPLAEAALAGGLVMTWARALGEFGATIMFAGNIEGRTQTLPIAVYAGFQTSLDASVAAAAILIVAAFAVLVAVRTLRWRPDLAAR
ncbi:MAG TPA: ABC transporter permease [Candidatus Limnocylindrales bacterium]